MAKIKEREKAVILRQQGTSISDIANKLRVSKSTVSMWCRDITLSEMAIASISQRSASKSTNSLLRYTESLRTARQERTERSKALGAEKVGELSSRDIYCIGLGLYWGEGYKRGSQEFGFTNSDPGMIGFYIKWLETQFNISRTDLILRVSINQSHEMRLPVVENFWSVLTGVKLSNFTKASLIKSVSKKVYSNASTHLGTLRVKVRRGTAMRREVLGALEKLSADSK